MFCSSISLFASLVITRESLVFATTGPTYSLPLAVAAIAHVGPLHFVFRVHDTSAKNWSSLGSWGCDGEKVDRSKSKRREPIQLSSGIFVNPFPLVDFSCLSGVYLSQTVPVPPRCCVLLAPTGLIFPHSLL